MQIYSLIAEARYLADRIKDGDRLSHGDLLDVATTLDRLAAIAKDHAEMLDEKRAAEKAFEG